MAGFRYQAYAPDGTLNTGVLEADSARQARAQLRGKGLTPYRVDVIEVRGATSASARLKLSRADLTRVTRSIATVLEAGLNIDEAFSALVAQAETQKEKQILAAVRSEVLAGNTLADAIALFPATFDDLYRTLVASGELAGKLPQVLGKLADHMEEQGALSARLATALIYPALVLLVAAGVVIAMMTYVVPQVVTAFNSSKAALPWLTRGLIAITQFLKTWGFPMLIAMIVMMIAFASAWRSEAWRDKVQRVLLRLPLVGKLLRSLDTARFASTLSILVGSGVPLTTAMLACNGVLRLAPMRTGVQQASVDVQSGLSLAKALERTQLMPPVLTQLVQSAEATGRMADALDRAAKDQERSVSTRLNMLVAVAEPLIIVVVGVIVLLIVLAVMTPIFEMNKLVAPR
jgi:general secretion pathway protein F